MGSYPSFRCVCTSSTSIIGIRFSTALRISEWFGCRSGSVYVKEAPTGYYIHSLFGRDGKDGIVQLGVFYRPLWELNMPIVVKPHLKSNLLVREEEDKSYKTFPSHEVVDDIRALVLQCNDEVSQISVLSTRMYEECMRLDDWIRPGEFEHWFVLVANETFLAVEAVEHTNTEYSRVKAMRFRTSMRTSPCFGELPSSDEMQKASSFTVTPTQMICGFFGTTEDNRLKTLGVAYVEKEDMDETMFSSESEMSDTWSVVTD